MDSKYKKLNKQTKPLVRRYCIKMIRIKIGGFIDGKSLAQQKNNLLFDKFFELYGVNATKSYFDYKNNPSVNTKETNNETIEPNGFVYFIINDKNKLCKIGFSVDPKKRIKVLQTGCPYPLRIYRTIEATMKMEKQLHKQFREYKTNGEWFSITGRLLDYLKSLA